MADRQGRQQHTAVVADRWPERAAGIKEGLAEHFDEVWPCAPKDLPRKAKALGRGDVVLLVVDRKQTLRPEDTRCLRELSVELARASRARRALIIAGDPTNNISTEALSPSAFYRVSQRRQKAPQPDPEADMHDAVERAVEVAKELKRLDKAARDYLNKLAKTQDLRHLLGTAMCLVDTDFRIWHMDTVHLRMTGGAALDGQGCWMAFHKSFYQRGSPCRGCAVAEIFNRPKGCDKPGQAREIASQVENRMRFFLVAAQAVPGSDGKLASEYSCDITDTPRVNCMPRRRKLQLLLEAITSRGFARARAWGYAAGRSTTLELRQTSGYDGELPDLKPGDAEKDAYFFNSIVVAKKPQVYSEEDLGKEYLRPKLNKQNVDWWMEFPFFDRTGRPVGLLSVDSEGAAREKDIRHLLEVQQIANNVESLLARERQERLIQESLEALRQVRYDRATLWDLLPDDLHTIMGRQSIGPGRDVRGVISSLYHERFLYEAAVLHRIPQILDRAEVVDRSAVCRDYVADGTQELVFPLFRSGRPIGFLIISNPGSGRRLEAPKDTARVQPLAEALAGQLEQAQPFLDRFSTSAAPVLWQGEGPPVKGDLIACGIEKLASAARHETGSSHVVLRVLREDALWADWQLGFEGGSPRDLKPVDLRDGRIACVRALRLGFPCVVGELRRDQDFKRFREEYSTGRRRQEMKKLQSMIAITVRDTIGVLGCLELFSATDPKHFILHEEQDWAHALALRLGLFLRVRESLRAQQTMQRPPPAPVTAGKSPRGRRTKPP